MEQVLVLASQVKHNAVRERKSLNWNDVLQQYDKWLKEHSLEVGIAALAPALNLVTNQVTGALDDALDWQGVFASFSLRDIEAEAFWSKYLPPFMQGVDDTTAAGVKELIAEGLAKGWSNDQIIKQLGLLFEQWMGNPVTASAWLSERTPINRREMISRSETIRASNAALDETYKQVGVSAKEWYTAADPCEFCAPMNGKIIDIDQTFYNKGDVISIGDGDAIRTMNLNYSDVGYPPLHVNCRCVILPVIVDVDIPVTRQGDWTTVEVEIAA